jgi:hypothetical protein
MEWRHLVLHINIAYLVRYHYRTTHFTVGVMELDDPAHPELQLPSSERHPPAAVTRGVGSFSEPTFTLYLYDRDVNQVRACVCGGLLAAASPIVLSRRCVGPLVCQTIIRRLGLSQMSDPSLNPFIERYPSELERRSSVAPSTPSAIFPRATPVNSDLVVGAGPREPAGTLQ